MITTKDQLQEYVDDTMTNVRAIKGKNFEQALRMLYESINTGHMFGMTMAQDVTDDARKLVFNRYTAITAAFMMHVIQDLGLTRDDYAEMLRMSDNFSKKSLELLVHLNS